MNPHPDNLTPAIDSISEEVKVLVDGYLTDTLSSTDLARLEAILREDVAARRFFARYAEIDRDLYLEAHARSQADAALRRIGVANEVAPLPGRARMFQIRPLRWLAAAAAIAVALGVGFLAARSQQNTPGVADRQPVSRPASQPASADVAWLVNAQNCLWTSGSGPSDLHAGTVLSLDRGLAELKFRSGAVLLLEGPAILQLVSDNSARLERGRLTGKVHGPVKGFELLSPRGKVIDLGTEFGVSVAASGRTDVYVFDGKVQAIADGASGKVTDLTHDQSARIEDGTVTLRPVVASAEEFVRQIVPAPVIEPRTMNLNFGKGYDGTLADAQGMGSGLTHRLPGTGTAISPYDPNLFVNSQESQLELTTTNSDINHQVNMPTGEYAGVRLADLGFTGSEDFEVQMFVPNIPALQNVGQFGLYAGAKSDRVIRGGLISRSADGQYTLFMTNNDGGRDASSHFVGLFSMGDDLRIRLTRTNGKYALTVANEKTGASSTLAIKHPDFLDAENDLYVGLFGANTRSEVRKTLLIKEFSVTVWTTRTNPSVAAR
ncbi:FecR family protein [Humisphaera borealis]|uniref:FecR protein domain-containing protein n=1 Tax=Humisphaera borealis TaxID=2807512 RepID=A0A7M2WT52_9BACT|nr:hypothetical protein [Humisphaera borealis]QOV88705.1 hypothetical protein IPV69_21095 [Humisphaera borealis]